MLYEWAETCRPLGKERCFLMNVVLINNTINFYLLVSFPNICILPHFQSIYYMLVFGDIFLHLSKRHKYVHSWCVFVRASLHMRSEEKSTRCHWMFYCTYDKINMFRALLCSSSGARDYMCVITSYGLQCLVAGCRVSDAGQQAMRPGRGMLHDWVVQHPSSWTHSLLSCT